MLIKTQMPSTKLWDINCWFAIEWRLRCQSFDDVSAKACQWMTQLNYTNNHTPIKCMSKLWIKIKGEYQLLWIFFYLTIMLVSWPASQPDMSLWYWYLVQNCCFWYIWIAKIFMMRDLCFKMANPYKCYVTFVEAFDIPLCQETICCRIIQICHFWVL